MNSLKEKLIRWKAGSDEEKFSFLLGILILPPTLLFVLFIWLQFTILPMVKLSYIVSSDLNHDGIFTMSDALLLIKEMFYAPGAAISKEFSGTFPIQFFESNVSYQYNILAFIISVVLLSPILLSGFVIFLINISEKGFLVGASKAIFYMGCITSVLFFAVSMFYKSA